MSHQNNFTLNLAKIAVLTASLTQAALPAKTLAGCQAFAALFDNTCGSAMTWAQFQAHTGTQLTCTGGMPCPGSAIAGTNPEPSDDPCVFKHKLCVTCSQATSNDPVMIKVQTNGIPNHCFTSTVNQAEPFEVEWEVKWQADTTNVTGVESTVADSSKATDEILCDIQRTSQTNIPTASGYKLLNQKTNRRMLQPGQPGGGNMDPIGTASGIAFSGGYIFNSLAGGNVDAVENEAKTLDVCLSHPTPSYQFHYHYWSPCIFEGKGFASKTAVPPLCKDTSTCLTDTPTFVKTQKSTANNAAALPYPAGNGNVYGLAKDGHLLVGPTKSDGSEWGVTDRDMCNGAIVENTYVYVATKEFPYVLGCFGPAPQQKYQAGCSNTNFATLLPAAAVTNFVQLSIVGAVSIALSLMNF